MAEAIDRYQQCQSMLGRLQAWRAEALLGDERLQLFDKHLECGGDPHFEDRRPYRGSEELKAWGDAFMAEVRAVSAAAEAWSEARGEALRQALSAMGRELGASSTVGSPLYDRITHAYVEGDRIRRERLDGVPLLMQRKEDAADKAPFRDALLKKLKVDAAELSSCVGRAYGAFESLILDDAGAGNIARMSRAEAQKVLSDMQISSEAQVATHIERLRPSVLETYGLARGAVTGGPAGP
ncbi:hypothetical protein [Geopseudomonas aromaticivorans]